jgi:hypothetical protein
MATLLNRRYFPLMLLVIMALLPCIGFTSDLGDMSIAEAEQKVRDIQKVGSELNGLAHGPIPRDVSADERKQCKKYRERVRTLAKDYQREATRLEKEIQKAKTKKKNTIRFVPPKRLTRDTTILSTEISQAVNESNRMNAMFSKILQKLDEGQRAVIRNM